MTATRIWLPFTRAELIARKRCPDCGFDPPTQGHRDGCPYDEGTA